MSEKKLTKLIRMIGENSIIIAKSTLRIDIAVCTHGKEFAKKYLKEISDQAKLEKDYPLPAVFYKARVQIMNGQILSKNFRTICLCILITDLLEQNKKNREKNQSKISDEKLITDIKNIIKKDNKSITLLRVLLNRYGLHMNHKTVLAYVIAKQFVKKHTDLYINQNIKSVSKMFNVKKEKEIEQ